MEALKKIAFIKDNQLIVKGLSALNGQEVDVIITPHLKHEVAQTAEQRKKLKAIGGSLHKYANPELRKLEDKAIDIAMIEKYGSS